VDGPGWQLAQVNIARLLAPLDAPEVAGFVAALDPVNALADRSPGFVWRLQSDGGDATSIRAYDDDRIIVNLTVWASLEDLRGFVFGGLHVDILRRRRAWFSVMDEAYAAMWWVPAGTTPTVDEAKERLAILDREGPTPAAFTFRAPFPAPTA
jgi:hypothetical protein